MSEEFEDLRIRLDLPLHLILDLRAHEGKLLLRLVRMEISSDFGEFDPCLLNLAMADQLAR
jgi:hypothetical protein